LCGCEIRRIVSRRARARLMRSSRCSITGERSTTERLSGSEQSWSHIARASGWVPGWARREGGCGFSSGFCSWEEDRKDTGSLSSACTERGPMSADLCQMGGRLEGRGRVCGGSRRRCARCGVRARGCAVGRMRHGMCVRRRQIVSLCLRVVWHRRRCERLRRALQRRGGSRSCRRESRRMWQRQLRLCGRRLRRELRRRALRLALALHACELRAGTISRK
jgi:hypothetical protein